MGMRTVATIAAIGSAAICQWLMIATLVRHQRQNTLSSRRFATIFAIGLSCSTLFLFFVNLILGGLVPLPAAMLGLGLGISALNFLCAYPIAYYLHKHGFGRISSKLK